MMLERGVYNQLVHHADDWGHPSHPSPSSSRDEPHMARRQFPLPVLPHSSASSPQHPSLIDPPCPDNIAVGSFEELVDHINTRRQYNNYKNKSQREFVETIFDVFFHCLDLNIQMNMSYLAHRSGVARTTLIYWRDQYLVENQWRPWNNLCGRHLRLFTEEERARVNNMLVHELRATLRPITMNTVRELFHTLRPDAPRTVSNGFLQDFKKEFHFTSRRAHLVSRVVDPSHILATNFVDEMNEVFFTVEHSRIFNMDESMIRWTPRILSTWEKQGQTGVRIKADVSEKEGITAVCLISASGQPLRPFFLRSLTAPTLSPTNTKILRSGKKGWMTAVTMCVLLRKLRQTYDDDLPLHLVLDSASTHKARIVHDLAHNLNIRLHMVPAGTTSLLQPLDFRIFGVVKQKMRAKFTAMVAEGGSGRDVLNFTSLMEQLRVIFLSLTVEQVKAAWACLLLDAASQSDVSDDEAWEEGSPSPSDGEIFIMDDEVEDLVLNDPLSTQREGEEDEQESSSDGESEDDSLYGQESLASEEGFQTGSLDGDEDWDLNDSL